MSISHYSTSIQSDGSKDLSSLWMFRVNEVFCVCVFTNVVVDGDHHEHVVFGFEASLKIVHFKCQTETAPHNTPLPNSWSHACYERSPRIRLASWISLGMIVTYISNQSPLLYHLDKPPLRIYSPASRERHRDWYPRRARRGRPRKPPAARGWRSPGSVGRS